MSTHTIVYGVGIGIIYGVGTTLFVIAGALVWWYELVYSKRYVIKEVNNG